MAFDHLPFDYEPIPGEDGWRGWNLQDKTRYNAAVLGEMRVRREGNFCRLRMYPERRHTNLQDVVHGATTLGLIDIALFAAMHVLGKGEAGPSVTLELSTQFVGAGDPERPLDAVTEIVRETGRLAFCRGQVVQDDDVVASFSGIIRKMNSRK
ncbi:PaaI family thioesterase [Alteriqipengyuania flavescens]|uniref:PaaI family thioesterase n=1 Tax=Alteriqipengyuania flavescens TaxID=3053610 RepID=UPI0025B4A534|nr:PaaI family thioesterase [Alteriqipengyuania flavescens]WJY18453.1 PaaI family thioesterase [Alteriqipengyuania flavescens]WJY24394.1 PaaI family thioesterase [Alteriqipengyuania flavescens]